MARSGSYHPSIAGSRRGSCISVLAKMLLFDVALSAELEAYGRRILCFKLLPGRWPPPAHGCQDPLGQSQRPTPRLGSASIAHELLAVTHRLALLFLLGAGHRDDAHRIAFNSARASSRSVF